MFFTEFTLNLIYAKFICIEIHSIRWTTKNMFHFVNRVHFARYLYDLISIFLVCCNFIFLILII